MPSPSCVAPSLGAPEHHDFRHCIQVGAHCFFCCCYFLIRVYVRTRSDPLQGRARYPLHPGGWRAFYPSLFHRWVMSQMSCMTFAPDMVVWGCARVWGARGIGQLAFACYINHALFVDSASTFKKEHTFHEFPQPHVRLISSEISPKQSP